MRTLRLGTALRRISGGMLLASVPVTIADGSSGNHAAGAVVWSSACAQAKECEAATNYICSKKDRDYKDQKCSSGCDEE